MTECNQSSFGFEACGRREIVARFDGGTISSDGGALLLRQTDKRLNLLPRLAECFLDGRNQDLVEHSIQEMLAQTDLRSGAGLRRHQRSRATAERSGLWHSGRTGGAGRAAGGQEHAEPDGTGRGHQGPVQEDHVLERGAWMNCW